MGKIFDALEKIKKDTDFRLADDDLCENEPDLQEELLSRPEAPQPYDAEADPQTERTAFEQDASNANITWAGGNKQTEGDDQSASAPAFQRGQIIDANLIAYTAPHSYEAELFRMLRTNVLFSNNIDLARSIMVASGAPSEGKSFIAANLAISIAQNVDKHVLLVDADMRSPTINRLFGFGTVPGLSDYLLQGRPLPSLLLKTCVERLTILPGGYPPPNPSELLSSGRMADMLQEVTQRYNDRHIIIDTPPMQLTAEAHALAKFVDGVLLVIRLGRSNKDTTAELVEKIGKDKFLGVVGNFADKSQAALYSKGRHKYYYDPNIKKNL